MRPSRRRAFVTAGAACFAAVAVAGCGPTTSKSSSSTVVVPGHTLGIFISDPKSLAGDAAAQDVIAAEQLAFKAHKGEVKDYSLALFTVRGTTPSDNARSAIVQKRAIAYLGEIQPGVSDQTVGITNAAGLLQVSPTDTALELGQETPAVSGSPKVYFQSYSTYGRTFARVVPSSADEAKAQVAEMKSVGVTRLGVTDDGSDYGKALASAVRSDAKAAGLTIDDSVSEANNGYFYGAQSPAVAARFFNRIAKMAPTAKLFGTSSLNSAAFTSAISASAKQLYVSIPGFMPNDLTPDGKTFTAAFKTAYGHAPNTVAIFGWEAMSAVLRVLEKAGHGANNRTTVVNDFLGQHNVPSVLGPYSIDSSGNTSLDAFVFARMQSGNLVPFAAAPSS